jgi:hypothetical protein
VRALVRRVERQSEGLAKAMAAAFAAELPTYRQLPIEALEQRTLEACRQHLRLFIETVDTGELPADHAFEPVRASAARRGAEGVALEDLLAAYHVGARLGWEALRTAAQPGEDDALIELASLVLLYTDAVSRAVAGAYLDERLRGAAEAHAAEWALVDAVLAGRPTDDAAARANRRLASAYAVLLLQVTVPRERLRGFEAAIAGLGGGEALWRLTAIGANILVPTLPADAPDWVASAEEVVDLCAAVAGADVLAAVAWGEGPAGVARAGDEAVEVLRLVGGTGRPPGVYRLDDVLLEAALSGTAAGPADRLSAILAPLETGSGPELLATLEAYLANDADRRRTASALHVHPNTLDYRLRRIADLTGRSPATSRGLQVLGAALTLRRVGRIGSTPGRSVTPT